MVLLSCFVFTLSPGNHGKSPVKMFCSWFLPQPTLPRTTSPGSSPGSSSSSCSSPAGGVDECHREGRGLRQLLRPGQRPNGPEAGAGARSSRSRDGARGETGAAGVVSLIRSFGAFRCWVQGITMEERCFYSFLFFGNM